MFKEEISIVTLSGNADGKPLSLICLLFNLSFPPCCTPGEIPANSTGSAIVTGLSSFTPSKSK
jgi:hypothetical protein